MRIQHNIMAMNAYRNYNTNTSAVAKNLEKLSSGYKINRAGDDAAGLAISEKMRAQITGLNTASKNVKDGISLVKTAEGAMQEVQDMLNRMVDLATQSANGTYQDEVDREAIQAEIDQLNSEINRIADSANFNGIKLLDGSLDKSAVTGVTYNKVAAEDIEGLLPDDMTGKTQIDVDDIGKKGALETDGSTAPSKNSFQVSLDGVSVEVLGDAPETFTLKIGEDVEMSIELTKGKYSGAQLASKLAEKYNQDANKITLGDEGQKFDIKTDGNVLKFSNNEKVDAGLNTSATVSWSLGGAAGGNTTVTDVNPGDANTFASFSANVPLKAGTVQIAGKYFALSGATTQALVEPDGSEASPFTINMDGKTADAVLGEIAEKLQGVSIDGIKGQFNASVEGGKLKFTATEKGAIQSTDGKELDKAAFTAALKDVVKADGASDPEKPEEPAEDPVTVTGPTTKTATFTDGADGSKNATIAFDVAGFSVDKAGSVDVAIGGKTYTINISEEEFNNKDTAPLDELLAGKLVTAMNADPITDAGAGDFTAAASGAAITLTSANQKAVTDSDGFTGITAYTVTATPPADNTEGAGLVLAQEEGAATSGKLTAAVTLPDDVATPAANDTITFANDDSSVSVTFKYENDAWALDSTATNKVPTDFTATFDGETLSFISDVPGKDVASIKDTVGSLNATGTGSYDSKTITVAESAWTAGTDAVKDPEQPTEPEEPKTELVASGELKANSVDFADAATPLDATGIQEIKDLGEVTVGDIKVDLSGLDLTVADTGKTAVDKILKAAQDAVKAWNDANPEADYTYGNVRISKTADGANAGDIIAQAAGDGIYILADKIPAEQKNNGAGTTTTTGYINTGIQNVTNYDAGSKAQLANAAVDFDKVGAWQDGAKITIGDTTYTVAVGADSKFKDVKNVIDLTDQTAGAVDKTVAAKRLTEAAAGNSIFTVGHDGTGKTTLQQKSSVKDTTDMTTEAKFASYLGVATPDSIDGAAAGKGLTLQIGDTSESFNQLTVSIGDIHADALGVGSINVGTQEGAQAAINVIKTAINQVSSIRGTLGATQNRLEHTSNNLSVMAENIQDAESSIRDTDIAEEMMAYTKNNILVQSAQAMLAQANQVPQGVLQLLG